MNQFGFVQPVDRLDQGFVVAVTTVAQRGLGAFNLSSQRIDDAAIQPGQWCIAVSSAVHASLTHQRHDHDQANNFSAWKPASGYALSGFPTLALKL